MTCIPDELWTDPGCLLLVAKHRRLWVLAVAIARLRARWHPDDVDRWSDAQWVIMLRRDTNVNTNVRQWGLDLAKMRYLGVLDADRVELRFCRRNPAAGADEDFALPGLVEAGMPRRRFPSDEPQYRRQKAAASSTPQPLHETPQSTPQSSAKSSANASAGDSTTTHARPVTGPVPESGEEKYISPTGNRPDSGPVRSDGGATGGVRMAPPMTVVERLVELGMPRPRAEGRVAEFGEQRCLEAIQSMPYARKQPIRDPIGYIVDYLVNKRPTPKGLIEAWERQAQESMTLPVSVPGGRPAATAHETPADPEPAGEADPEDLAAIAAFREQWGEHVDGMINAA